MKTRVIGFGLFACALAFALCSALIWRTPEEQDRAVILFSWPEFLNPVGIALALSLTVVSLALIVAAEKAKVVQILLIGLAIFLVAALPLEVPYLLAARDHHGDAWLDRAFKPIGWIFQAANILTIFAMVAISARKAKRSAQRA